MALIRRSPRKSTSGFLPIGPAPSPSRFLGRTLFIDAHASSSVPSTVKFSHDISFRRRASSKTRWKNCCAMSCSKSRSLFLEKVEASKAGAITFRSKNHLNSR